MQETIEDQETRLRDSLLHQTIVAMMGAWKAQVYSHECQGLASLQLCIGMIANGTRQTDEDWWRGYIEEKRNVPIGFATAENMNKYDTDYSLVYQEIQKLTGQGTWEVELATREGRLKIADKIEPLGADAELLECLRR